MPHSKLPSRRPYIQHLDLNVSGLPLLPPFAPQEDEAQDPVPTFVGPQDFQNDDPARYPYKPSESWGPIDWTTEYGQSYYDPGRTPIRKNNDLSNTSLEPEEEWPGMRKQRRLERHMRDWKDNHPRNRLLRREKYRWMNLRTRPPPHLMGVASDIEGWVPRNQKSSSLSKGFTKAEAHAAGAGDIIGPMLPLLDEPGGSSEESLLPIFRRGPSFPTLSDETYELLRPALRLANNIILSAVGLDVFYTLFYGTREQFHEVEGLMDKTDVFRIRTFAHQRRRFGPREHEVTLRALVNLLPKITIAFARMTSPKCWGQAVPVIYRNRKRGRHDLRVKIHLSSNMLRGLKRGRVGQQSGPCPSQSEKLRLNFMLATTIVHELSHAVEFLVEKRRVTLGEESARLRSLREPFLNDYAENELGKAVEEVIFGGTKSKFPLDISQSPRQEWDMSQDSDSELSDGDHVTRQSPFPLTQRRPAWDYTFMSRKGILIKGQKTLHYQQWRRYTTSYLIPTYWVYRLQTQRFWDSWNRFGNLTAFHYPKEIGFRLWKRAVAYTADEMRKAVMGLSISQRDPIESPMDELKQTQAKLQSNRFGDPQSQFAGYDWRDPREQESSGSSKYWPSDEDGRVFRGPADLRRKNREIVNPYKGKGWIIKSKHEERHPLDEELATNEEHSEPVWKATRKKTSKRHFGVGLDDAQGVDVLGRLC
ncbi:MAG: hypothetical protein M1814_003459 [Vezdaea aestivalis]|nr:MAG: hypothetical protein M1814_003459 [Vezdaea aestivalis]